MNDHDLDAVIRDVLHVEPSAGQTARLEQYWHAQSAGRGQGRVRIAGLAACLLLAASGALWSAIRFAGTGAARQTAIDRPRAVATAVVPSEPSAAPVALGALASAPMHRLTDDSDAKVDSSARASLAARPATPYEELMFRVSVAQAEKSMPPVAAPSMEATLAQLEKRVGVAGLPRAVSNSPDAALQVAIIRRLLTANEDAALRGYLALVADNQTRAAALAAAGKLEHPPVEQLFQLLEDEQKQIRTSAAITLGRINGPKVTAKLIKMVTEVEQAPAEAWIALFACRGKSADSFLAGASQHPRLLNQLNHARIFWQTVH